MTRLQRLLILIFLPLVAWLLHVFYCDWGWDSEFTASGIDVQRDLCGAVEFQYPGNATFRGLLTGRGISREAAMWSGIIVPLTLLAVWLYLLLGLRRLARLAKGRCTNCGYDLRGSSNTVAGKCPECGSQVK